MLMLLALTARAQRVPDLTLETLTGERIKLEEQYSRGPTLVTFWALWCAPCKLELKSLQAMYEKFKSRGLTIVAINQDSPKSLGKVRAFVAAQGLTFAVGLDPNGQHIQRFNGQTIPYTVLIDSTGSITYSSVGYIPGDERKFEAKIQEYLTSK
ncbi:MAG: peroxiredoxin family protein [Bacteroidota bacterium]